MEREPDLPSPGPESPGPQPDDDLAALEQLERELAALEAELDTLDGPSGDSSEPPEATR